MASKMSVNSALLTLGRELDATSRSLDELVASEHGEEANVAKRNADLQANALHQVARLQRAIAKERNETQAGIAESAVTVAAMEQEASHLTQRLQGQTQ
mmetsp:Transcript_51387/g.135795  ORF Transcript_51387/g.135795 Transcript_51387/m.135795 type:complete len:99 (+) Transcript_51387:3-299(+)